MARKSRTIPIQTWVSPVERDLIGRAVQSANQNLSSWMRRALLTAAKAELHRAVAQRGERLSAIERKLIADAEKGPRRPKRDMRIKPSQYTSTIGSRVRQGVPAAIEAVVTAYTESSSVTEAAERLRMRPNTLVLILKRNPKLHDLINARLDQMERERERKQKEQENGTDQES